MKMKKKKIAKKIVKKAKKVVKKAKKIKKVMKEFQAGSLHSSSKSGPIVSNPKQAVAIAYSEARKAVKKKRK